jgi:hypothetical protein
LETGLLLQGRSSGSKKKLAGNCSDFVSIYDFSVEINNCQKKEKKLPAESGLVCFNAFAITAVRAGEQNLFKGILNGSRLERF